MGNTVSCLIKESLIIVTENTWIKEQLRRHMHIPVNYFSHMTPIEPLPAGSAPPPRPDGLRRSSPPGTRGATPEESEAYQYSEKCKNKRSIFFLTTFQRLESPHCIDSSIPIIVMLPYLRRQQLVVVAVAVASSPPLSPPVGSSSLCIANFFLSQHQRGRQNRWMARARI